MFKTKNNYFIYFFIALSITLLFTFILFLALFQLNNLDDVDNEIYDGNGVKIVKLNKFNHFESVNKYLRDYYHYSLNQFSELVDNQEAFELKAIKESNYFYIDENAGTKEKGIIYYYLKLKD